jgi:hypothetical protein
MLEFFRKYQRFFFIFITAMVVASFSFFGTFSTFINDEVKVDLVIGEAVDGSPIKLSELQNLCRFLSTDRDDVSASPNVIPNFCNDGVIRHDLFRTGLADILAASYFEPLKEEFDRRLEKVKKFRPYMHPDVSSLNVRAIWERYMPSLIRELEAVQVQETASLSTFTHLSRLYLQQSYCPPEFLRRVLMHHHRDPRLQYEDFSLFGFHSLSDWFGKDFIDLAAAFILNGARAAEQRGYRVSLEEAKGDLLRNFNASMQRLSEMKNKPDLTFRYHLRMLGFDEKGAAEVWRTVLLFRRYFHGVGAAAFVDRLPYRGFASYALEKALVQLYQLPPSLRFKSVQDLIEFQVYLKAISQGKDPLAIPSSFLPLDEIEMKNPELVQSVYRAKVAEISKGEVGLKVPVKELWDWQLDDKNWAELKKKFSFLPNSTNRDERFQALEKLDFQNRAQLDRYSRLQWVDLHPAWIDDGLAAAQSGEKTISVSKDWISLDKVEKSQELTALLEKASSGDEAAKGALSRYSGDAKTYYRIENVRQVSSRHLLTLEEAKANGAIALAADRSLEAEYTKLRSQNPSKFQEKPFASVKEEVARLVFADVFKAMGGVPARRLEAYTKEALASLQINPEDPQILKGSGDPIVEQFKFERKQCEIQRTTQEEWMKEQAFLMVPKQWSSVHFPDDGDIAFFYFEEKKTHQEPIFEQMAFGKETLAADAQRYLAERLLEVCKKKQVITIPIQREKE